MTDERRERIGEIIVGIIEKQAFLLGEPAGRDELAGELDGGFKAAVNFSGHASGNLRLLASQATCQELAANVLGVDEEDIDDAAARDAIGEMLNVLCGNILTELAGEDPIFDLTPPTVEAAGADDWEAALNAPGALAFLMEDEPFVVSLSVEGL